MKIKSFLNRFLEPVRLTPKAYIWPILEAIGTAFYYIFSMEILRDILMVLELWEKEKFYPLLFIYFIVSVIYVAIIFSMYRLWRQNIVFNWSKKLYEKYLKKYIEADGNAVEKIGTGRFIAALEKGIHRWLNALFILCYYGVFNFLVILYTLYFVAQIHILWASFVLLGLIFASIIATFANMWMSKKRLLRYKEENESMHNTVIALMSKNELLQSGGLSSMLDKIKFHLEKARKYQYPVVIGWNIIEYAPLVILLLVRLGMYVYMANLIFGGQGSIGDFAIFITIIALMEKNLTSFLHMTRDILREFSSVSILWETFDNLPAIQWYDVWNDFISKKENIKIQNLSYSYGWAPVFKDFSLEILYGKKTAFVGASGWGKTTLLKLIAGYIYPEKGSIEVLWNTLSETKLKSYYLHIGYLTQEPWVFDASIRENMESVLDKSKESDEKVKEEKIIDALKKAKCDFVFELKKWIETQIGERGVRLSWGQKQRLAIAKIFLKNPEIILLDEPTSALDSFSEEAITEALEVLFKGRTVIIIAHRLQTVKKADDIIVFENGEVKERGRHNELVKEKWIYARMLELQSGF